MIMRRKNVTDRLRGLVFVAAIAEINFRAAFSPHRHLNTVSTSIPMPVIRRGQHADELMSQRGTQSCA
jgi:hypothetical protein